MDSAKRLIGLPSPTIIWIKPFFEPTGPCRRPNEASTPFEYYVIPAKAFNRHLSLRSHEPDRFEAQQAVGLHLNHSQTILIDGKVNAVQPSKKLIILWQFKHHFGNAT